MNANNVSNIWSQPIEGGPPKQITDFKDMLITGFCVDTRRKKVGVYPWHAAARCGSGYGFKVSLENDKWTCGYC